MQQTHSHKYTVIRKVHKLEEMQSIIPAKWDKRKTKGHMGNISTPNKYIKQQEKKLQLKLQQLAEQMTPEMTENNKKFSEITNNMKSFKST